MGFSASPLPPLTKQPKTWNEQFVEYVNTVQKTGIDIDNKQSYYVKYEDLANYWNEDDRLQFVVDFSHTAPIAADQCRIRQSFLRIWSCLVYIGHPDFITWFITQDIADDHISVVYDLILSRASQDIAAREVVRTFYEEHWKFWPVLFEKDRRLYKRSLDPRCVLPITFEDRLTPNDDYCKTIVSKVRIDESCCDFEEKTVAFKMFQRYHESSAAFENEVNLFEKLPANSTDVIVKCLGSFKQNQKYVVILELAPGGNFKDFLSKTRKPKSRQELLQLWGTLISLLNALLHLHNLAPGSRTIGCAHRDIKLENILVFPKSADHGREYDFSLKLTDFDTCTHIQAVSSTSDGVQNHDGGRTYCAPEASRIQERNEHELLTVPFKSDIWSLGAVFSEVIVWLAEGIEGIKAYETRRKQESSLLPGFRGSGFEACFHDGVKRLKCVDEVHKEARGLLISLDNITPLIQRLTETYMLVPADTRLDAKPLYQFFVNEIANLQPMSLPRLHTIPAPPSERPGTLGNLNREAISAEPRIGSAKEHFPDPAPTQDVTNSTAGQPSESQDTQETPDHQSQPDVVAVNKDPQLPQINVLAVNSWLDAGGRGTIPGMEGVLQELDGRDQLFVVDDSPSMRHHKDFLFHTSRALIAMATKVDPDRVEMVFTSNTSKFIKDRRPLFGGGANHMVGKIRSHFDKPSAVNSTNMELKMGQILSRVWCSLKPTSIYIMTDGVWQPSTSPGGGVEGPLRNFVSRMVQRSRNREFVTLQFIQFGHDPAGAERLRYLDDDLPKLDGMHN
ncbi:serine/threonine protein kinase [Apiospora arundinis]